MTRFAWSWTHSVVAHGWRQLMKMAEKDLVQSGVVTRMSLMVEARERYSSSSSACGRSNSITGKRSWPQIYSLPRRHPIRFPRMAAWATWNERHLSV